MQVYVIENNHADDYEIERVVVLAKSEESAKQLAMEEIKKSLEKDNSQERCLKIYLALEVSDVHGLDEEKVLDVEIVWQ